MRKKYNTYDLDSFEYGIGYTSKQEKFYFDKNDYEKIKDFCWFKDNSTGYFRSRLPNYGKKVSLHRVVMDAKCGEVIDHINHDLSDNRKSNLRKCTKAQNSANSVTRSDNKSGYPGVWYDKARDKWFAQISVKNQRINLGRFDALEDAIAAKHKAQNEYYKEFSYLNSIKQSERIGE